MARTDFRIFEAITHAQDKGIEVTKQSLAVKFYPDSSPATAIRNFNKLYSGKTRKIEPWMVHLLCETCKVDANFLFNEKSMK